MTNAIITKNETSKTNKFTVTFTFTGNKKHFKTLQAAIAGVYYWCGQEATYENQTGE